MKEGEKRQKILSICFLIIIMSFLFGFLFNVKPIGKAILIGYKDYIKEDSNVMDYLKAEITSIDSSINECVLGKYEIINLNGAFQKLLGKQVINDADTTKTVIKLNNGQLTFIYPKTDTKSFSESIIKLDSYLKKRGSSILYIQAPFKVSENDNELPTGIEDYTNYNADKFLNDLKENDVNYLDLRKEIEKDGLDHYSLFFKTDHHWLPETGFWAFTKIAKILKENYGFEYDEKYTNIDNYDKEVYKNELLGSKGKRVGTIYSGGLENMSLIYPRFETNLTYSAPTENIERKGDFYKVIFEKEHLGKNKYLDTPYCVYMGYDRPLEIIKNYNNKNNKKILVIKDSFARVTVPFLSLICDEVDSIDLRNFDNSKLIDYIDKSNPDLVLFIYNADIYRSDMKEMFDFRLDK